jgi:hypothetical protein
MELMDYLLLLCVAETCHAQETLICSCGEQAVDDTAVRRRALYRQRPVRRGCLSVRSTSAHSSSGSRSLSSTDLAGQISMRLTR